MEIEKIFTGDEIEESVEEESVNQREELIRAIKAGNTLPSGKTSWTVKRVEKASNSVIDKLYDEFSQSENRHKSEITGIVPP